MKKIIIDCDVGVDDALALMLAFHAPELEVKAVTGVSGNVPLETVFKNIQKVLSLIRPPRRPLIAKGADRPLKGEAFYAYSFHGEDGLRGAKIEGREGEEWWRVFPGRADELILKMARQYPSEMTLVAIAPLTNLALGLKKDPQGMRQLKEVVVMGGAVRTKGNITSYAEFNIFVDPRAAEIVFTSGLPITLVPLDVTQQIPLSPRVIEERVWPIRNSLSKFVIEATGYNFPGRQPRGRSEVIYLHDPLAVGVAIDPNLVSKERLSISVETQPGEFYGRTLEVAEKKVPGNQEMEVCLGVNSENFLELFLSRLKA
jgi:purine nucleosidase/pyrimidine-specific ribonucleoside hydrolase